MALVKPRNRILPAHHKGQSARSTRWKGRDSKLLALGSSSERITPSAFAWWRDVGKKQTLAILRSTPGTRAHVRVFCIQREWLQWKSVSWVVRATRLWRLAYPMQVGIEASIARHDLWHSISHMAMLPLHPGLKIRNQGSGLLSPASFIQLTHLSYHSRRVGRLSPLRRVAFFPAVVRWASRA